MKRFALICMFMLLACNFCIAQYCPVALYGDDNNNNIGIRGRSSIGASLVMYNRETHTLQIKTSYKINNMKITVTSECGDVEEQTETDILPTGYYIQLPECLDACGRYKINIKYEQNYLYGYI